MHPSDVQAGHNLAELRTRQHRSVHRIMETGQRLVVLTHFFINQPKRVIAIVHVQMAMVQPLQIRQCHFIITKSQLRIAEIELCFCNVGKHCCHHRPLAALYQLISLEEIIKRFHEPAGVGIYKGNVVVKNGDGGIRSFSDLNVVVGKQLDTLEQIVQ